jgi:hypothetical protein
MTAIKKKKRTDDIREGGKFAVGFASAALVFIGVFLVFESLKMSLVRSEAILLLPALVALVVSLSSLMLSYFSLSEQRLTRQAGTDPVLIAHFDQREDAAELIVIKISNVGAGAALKVKIDIETDQEGFDAGVFSPKNIGANPLRTIPQNDSISLNFGRGFELLKDPLPKPITVGLKYENIEGLERSQSFELDVLEMANLPVHRSLGYRQARATEDIAKQLSKNASDLDTVIKEITEMKSDFRQWAKVAKQK